MSFGFTLNLSDIDLLNIDSLDTDIPSKHFICLQDVVKTCLQDVFKTCLQDILKMFSAEQFLVFQDFFKTVCKMSSRSLQDIFARCLQDKELLRWRCFEDIFKTCLEDVLKTNRCLLANELVTVYML